MTPHAANDTRPRDPWWTPPRCDESAIEYAERTLHNYRDWYELARPYVMEALNDGLRLVVAGVPEDLAQRAYLKRLAFIKTVVY